MLILQRHFAMLDLKANAWKRVIIVKTYKVKKIVNKFPERLECIFRQKFPNSQPL